MKIDGLVACQQALRSVRNALVPISRLPREVLGHIVFSLVAHEQTSNKVQKPPLVVSQVCRDWRRLAVGNPALWTRPDFGRPKLAQMMLERSGKMALSVDLKPSFLDTARQHPDIFPRIRSLSISLNSDKRDLLLALFDGPLPVLESLEILGAFQRVRNVMLENDAMPRLTSLLLHNCIMPWSAACISGLTSLTIDMMYYDRHYVIHSADLYQIVQRNPALIVLRLKDVLSREEQVPDASEQLEPVVLSKLESLTLSGEMYASTLGRLLDAIQVPQLSLLKLPTMKTDPDFDWARFFGHLCRFLKNVHHSVHIPTADIYVYSFSTHIEDQTLVSMSVDLLASCSRGGNDKPFNVTLSLSRGGVAFNKVQDLVAALLECLPMDHLRDLSIQNSGTTPQALPLAHVWRATAALQELETLSVMRKNILGVDAELLKLFEPDSDNPMKCLLFPALKTFKWESQWFNPFRKTHWKKVLVSFVDATRSRAKLCEQTPGTFTLHQTWSTASRRMTMKAAEVLVRGAEVTGNFDSASFRSVHILYFDLKTSLQASTDRKQVWMRFLEHRSKSRRSNYGIVNC